MLKPVAAAVTERASDCHSDALADSDAVEEPREALSCGPAPCPRLPPPMLALHSASMQGLGGGFLAAVGNYADSPSLCLPGVRAGCPPAHPDLSQCLIL